MKRFKITYAYSSNTYTFLCMGDNRALTERYVKLTH